MSKVRFNLYRYQLLPKNRYFQGDLYGPRSIEELISLKNSFFANALLENGIFHSPRSELAVQRIYSDDTFFLFQIAVNRSINLETKDFNYKSVDTWPKIHVAVWNDPDQQVVAIQHRPAAFQRTTAVAKILFTSVEQSLSRHQLMVAWEPLFEKRAFWEMIDKYKGRIKKVEFELVTPNMAGISKVLPNELRDFAKRTNAVRSKVTLESDVDSALMLEPSDATVEGLTTYASNGGGNISVTIRGMKKSISTSTTIKEIEIEDAELHGDANIVAELIKSLMQ